MTTLFFARHGSRGTTAFVRPFVRSFVRRFLVNWTIHRARDPSTGATRTTFGDSRRPQGQAGIRQREEASDGQGLRRKGSAIERAFVRKRKERKEDAVHVPVAAPPSLARSLSRSFAPSVRSLAAPARRRRCSPPSSPHSSVSVSLCDDLSVFAFFLPSVFSRRISAVSFDAVAGCALVPLYTVRVYTRIINFWRRIVDAALVTRRVDERRPILSPLPRPSQRTKEEQCM